MKRCTYCGAEYPDDAVVCTIDQRPLPDPASDPTPSKKEKPTPRVFPEYQWTPRDAWKCIGTLVVLGFLLATAWFALRHYVPGFRSWRESGPGFLSWYALHYAMGLFVVAYFARTETLALFWRAFGLDRKPSNYVWFGIVATLFLRFFSHLVLNLGLSKGVRDEDIIAFKSTFGPERYLFLAPLVLLAPLFEECIYRGFLYKAFRGSFSMAVSVALIIIWTAYTHWNQYSVSWIAALGLSLFAIIQCYLREKSDSLWDCIFCHMAFNGSLLFLYSSYH
jgi:membrane protease YdiL (CAAX protease family)